MAPFNEHCAPVVVFSRLDTCHRHGSLTQIYAMKFVPAGNRLAANRSIKLGDKVCLLFSV